MNASQLLHTINSRGGKASVRHVGDIVKVRVCPNSLADDLESEIKHLKPQLIELLNAGSSHSKTSGSPVRETGISAVFPSVSESASVPANPRESACGAVRICKVLQSFARLFLAARRGELPLEPLRILFPDQDVWEGQSARDAVMEIEKAWTEQARQCRSHQCGLTPSQELALTEMTRFLDGISASWDGEVWLDLDEVSRDLENDFLAMNKRIKQGNKN